MLPAMPQAPLAPILVDDPLPPFPFMDWERYEPLGYLGEGCFGVVYKVRDRELDRVVALKFLHTASPARMALLRQEARAQAQLDHPMFCRLHEVGEREGRPYLVMQWVDGRPLDEVFTELTLEAFVRVLAELAEALDHGHRLGLAHRDLKASNILMLAQEQGGYRPCIVDFGLALLGEDARRAYPGDLWALGELAYTLLGGYPSGVGPSSLVRDPSLGDPDRPRLDVLNPAVPGVLADVVARCQSLEAGTRFPDAATLARALRDWLARQDPTPRRWPWILPLVGLALAGGGLGLWHMRRLVPVAEKGEQVEGVRAELLRLQQALARDGERLRALEHRLTLATQEEDRQRLRVEMEALRRSMQQNQKALEALGGRLSSPARGVPGEAQTPARVTRPRTDLASGDERPPRLLQRRVPVFPLDLLEGAAGLPNPLEVPVDVRVDAQGRAVEGLVGADLPAALRARVLEAALASHYAPAQSGGIPEEGWLRITYRFAKGMGVDGNGPRVLRLAPLTVEAEQFERLRALTGGAALAVQVRIDAQGKPQAIQPQHALPPGLLEAVHRAVQSSAFQAGLSDGGQEQWVTVAFPLR